MTTKNVKPVELTTKDKSIDLPGVYVIQNTVNGKKYIGSTHKSLCHRLQNHLTHLRKGTHKSIHLQHAWIKYGENNFIFKIVYCGIEKEVVKLEQELMDTYLTYNRSLGYNINIQAKSCAGRILSDEHKARIRCSHTVSNNKKRTYVKIKDVIGNTEYYFKSLREAAKMLKISRPKLKRMYRNPKIDDSHIILELVENVW